MNKLAIVIPYYKIDFFEDTLKSVAAQTDRRFTLYIGNDASPHDPLPLIRKYFPEGNYKYYSYPDNLGGKNLAMQWERILENVQEEWFQILGDDDMVSENFVEEFYGNLPEVEEHGCNVVKYSQYWIDNKNTVLNQPTNLNKLTPIKKAWYNKHFLKQRSSLSEHIFRKLTYDKYKFHKMPLGWYSDDLAVINYSEKKPLYFICKASVAIRVSDISISGRNDNEEQKAGAQYLYIENLLKEHPYLFNRDEIIETIERHIYQTWKERRTLKINLPHLYLKTRQWKKLKSIPLTYLRLFKNSYNH